MRKGVKCKPAVTRFCICQCLKDCTILFCLSLSLCVSRASLSLSLTLSFLGIITNEAISRPLSWTFLTMMPSSSGWEHSLSSAWSHSLLLPADPDISGEGPLLLYSWETLALLKTTRSAVACAHFPDQWMVSVRKAWPSQ